MARITIYKNSFLATLVSICGYIGVVCGVMVMFEGDIAAGILMLAVGIGLAVWASKISQNKQFKTWKKQVEVKGLVPGVQSSVQTAIQVYNTNPSTKTLNYIRTLNPAAAENIAQQLAAKKANAKKK